jgi:curli biogenesis system outer membrane secretion channel CsgG
MLAKRKGLHVLRMRKKELVGWLLACWSVLGLLAGCSQSGPKGGVATVATPSPVASETTKVVVLRLENSTKQGKSDRSTGEDRLIGNGIKAQIVNALSQSGRFTVVTNSGPREVLQRGILAENGDIGESIRNRLGSLGDAEFIIAGAFTTYRLSKDSKKAGVDADLLFRESQAQTVSIAKNVELAKRIFGALRPGGIDRIEYELWLYDAKTGRRIALTSIEGIPSDSSETLATPMQQALRGSVAKAVDWISSTQAAYKAGTLPLPAVVERKRSPQPEPKPAKVTKGQPPKLPVEPDLPPEEPMEATEKEPESVPAPTAKTPKSELENWGTPAAKTPKSELENWGTPASQPVPAIKSPTPDSEEWGEQ